MDEMFVEALAGFGQFFLICVGVAVVMMIVLSVKQLPPRK